MEKICKTEFSALSVGWIFSKGPPLQIFKKILPKKRKNLKSGLNLKVSHACIMQQYFEYHEAVPDNVVEAVPDDVAIATLPLGLSNRSISEDII